MVDLNLLLAYRRPELDGLQDDRLLRVPHSHRRQAEQRSLHVKVHLAVVQAHDANETFERADLDCRGRALRRLADDLHNVISLTLEISEASR